MPPAPVERYDLPHPTVPPALDGLTILHVSDLHIRRPALASPPIRDLLDALDATPADLIALTGDYMNTPGDEPAAMRVLHALAEAWRPRLGVFGVFGNHDSAQMTRLARQLQGVTWLEHRAIDLPGLPLRVIGTTHPEDMLGTVLSLERDEETTRPGDEARNEAQPDSASSSLRRSVPAPAPFPLTLAHHPTEIFPAADLNLPILLAGHTHAGQIRLTRSFAPHTSCDLPPHLASGVLRLRSTLCCISRGVGCAFLEARFNCPPQVPLYTLRRGPLPGPTRDPNAAHRVRQVIPW